MIGQSLTSFKFYQKTIKHVETIIFDRQTFFPKQSISAFWVILTRKKITFTLEETWKK